jgi:hypothetical protein
MFPTPDFLLHLTVLELLNLLVDAHLGSIGPNPEGLLDECLEVLEVGDGLGRGGGR